MTPHGPADRAVAVWDLPTRAIHWLLAVLVLGAWVSFRYAEAFGDVKLVWHRWIGLAILTLLVWRVLWGFGGGPTARFASFVCSPFAAWGYARDLAAGRFRRHLGHNPLGAHMVLALLAALIAQGSLGLFAVDDNEIAGGPLHRLVSEAANVWAMRWHGRIFHYAILPLVAVHIAANVLYGLVKKEPLIRAMVTGRKPAADYADSVGQRAPGSTTGRALACLLAAAALVLGGILAAGGRL